MTSSAPVPPAVLPPAGRAAPTPRGVAVPGTSPPPPVAGNDVPGTPRPWPTAPKAEDIYVQATLDIEPVSKARVRVSPAEYIQIGGQRVQAKKARGFSTQITRQFQENIGWLLRQAKVQRNDVDDLGVHAVFYVRGYQRRDLDNLIKSLLDGCNGVAWRDDQQVVQLVSEVVRGDDAPRIDLTIYVVNSRGRRCTKCGAVLTSKQISLGNTFCSKACYDSDQRKGAYRACVVCGTAVYRTADKANAANTYCSPECRAARRGNCRMCGAPNSKPWSGNRFCSTECSVTWHRQRTLARTSRPGGQCTDCGGPTYSAGSKRCRACHIANVSLEGMSPRRSPAYDACPDCGGRKRATSVRCMDCFHVAMREKKAGVWAKVGGR